MDGVALVSLVNGIACRLLLLWKSNPIASFRRRFRHRARLDLSTMHFPQHSRRCTCSLSFFYSQPIDVEWRYCRSNSRYVSRTTSIRVRSIMSIMVDKTVPMLRQVKSETRRDVPMDWEVESTRPYAKHDVSLSRPFSTWSLSDDEPTLSLRKSNVPSSRFVQPLAPSQLASQASFSISTV